jgi:Holliday junction resolvasome RuvABC ATP-dependent DNA helicase subunit
MNAVVQQQTKKLFFDNTPTRQYRGILSPPPTLDEARWAVSPDNPDCPLNELVVSKKNKEPLDALRTAAFAAMQKPDHSLRGFNFAIYAGPGQGKTTVVKHYAKTVGIPFVQVSCQTMKTTWQIFKEIAAEFERCGHPLVPVKGTRQFVIPPCLVFFDEVHSLPLHLRVGGDLLKAMELRDGWLRTSPDEKEEAYQIDCWDVCWAAATTDPGLLFQQSEAFHDRFSIHITWNSAGVDEIVGIVGGAHTELPNEACRLVAKYAPSPRKAVSFGTLLLAKQRMLGCSWEEAARIVAAQNGIDEWGMSKQQVTVLKALGQRPYSKANLLVIAKVRMEELERMILPHLIDDVEGRGSLIVTTPRCTITKAGLAELDKRGIPHVAKPIDAEIK